MPFFFLLLFHHFLLFYLSSFEDWPLRRMTPSLPPFQKASLLLTSLLELLLLIHTKPLIFMHNLSFFRGSLFIFFFPSPLRLDTISGVVLGLVYVYQSLSASRLQLISKGTEISQKVKFSLMIF